jgi:Rad3-related DNA helicase
VKVLLYDAEGARELSLHTPASENDNPGESLFTSPEAAELQRIYEWSKETQDGSLSDFEIEPIIACGISLFGTADFVRRGCRGRFGLCEKCTAPVFFQRARARINSADVLVVNHTLFFTLRRHDGRNELRAASCSRTTSLFSTKHHTVETRRLAAHRNQHFQQPGALRSESALESQNEQRNARVCSEDNARASFVADALIHADDFLF